MPFVTCAGLPANIVTAVQGMTPAQITALCTALSCPPTAAALTAALATLPGAAVPGNVLTIDAGGVPVYQAPSGGGSGVIATPTVPPAPVAGVTLWTNTSAGTVAGVPSGVTAVFTGAVPAWQPLYTADADIAVATKSASQVVPNATFTAYTWDAVTNSSFGTFNAGTGVFTFTRAVKASVTSNLPATIVVAQPAGPFTVTAQTFLRINTQLISGGGVNRNDFTTVAGSTQNTAVQSSPSVIANFAVGDTVTALGFCQSTSPPAVIEIGAAGLGPFTRMTITEIN